MTCCGLSCTYRLDLWDCMRIRLSFDVLGLEGDTYFLCGTRCKVRVSTKTPLRSECGSLWSVGHDQHC